MFYSTLLTRPCLHGLPEEVVFWRVLSLRSGGGGSMNVIQTTKEQSILVSGNKSQLAEMLEHLSDNWNGFSTMWAGKAQL